MKKLILIVALFISMNCYSQNVVREGNTFSSVVTKKESKITQTKYTWKDSKGKSYPIFMSESGSCFIKKVSKKGKEYKQYLPKEVSAQICKELNVEYKPKR